MKSLKLFFAAVTILFISCDKDDDTTPVDSKSLIGSWSLISLQADIDLETDFSGIPIKSSTKSVGENFDYTLTFTETTYAVEGSYDLVTTGTVNGVVIDEDTQSISEISESGTYEFSDSSIKIDGQLYEFEINEIDTSGLSLDQNIDVAFNNDGDLVMTQKQEATITQDGVSVSYTINATTIFKRK
ncbi:hypothetical protein [Flagellimonas pacifica]|uniref:Lipocalin-like domain-containing protein n=1 Tax=Flagellimonas pacifica TaxID=1247520 RepID=A0A285MUH2_9FLAO|nr:hypothetical protein [Allomuricauda parva]SNY99466.1 hypothetical protein SAMN06265377_1273 [Allomuricauda parva]